MKEIYIVKDRTDANVRKPFVGIFKTESQAKQKVANLQSKVKPYAQSLISYEPVTVEDFDTNKTSVYVVYDKTDSNYYKPFMSMHFEMANAEKKLKALRAKVAPHAHKLIYTRMENIG